MDATEEILAPAGLPGIPPAGPPPPGEPGWARLEDQLAYYDARAKKNQRWYRGLKVFQIATGALIPVVAGVGASAWLTGSLGSLVVINEGVNQLFRFHDNWVTYRATCEALRREKYLYLAPAPPYSSAKHPRRLLAARVEAIVAQEQKQWIAAELPQEKQAPQE